MKHVCQECHETFKPSMKEFIWSRHTARKRKLTCTKCRHKGFCMEVYDDCAINITTCYEKMTTYGESVEYDSLFFNTVFGKGEASE